MSDVIRPKRYKPGETCKISGQYTNTDGDQITMVKGATFPATPRPRMTWRLSDESRGKR